MSRNETTLDCKEIAQSFRGQKPPYACPICLREYRSLTGILYHLGQIGPSLKAPRCVLGEDTPQGSPKAPGSPGSAIKRKSRRDLTWAEAQRLVEVEFESCFRRIEIDNALDVSYHSEEEDSDNSNDGETPRDRRGSMVTRTPQRRGKGGKSEATPQSRGKWSSKSKNKGKRKSKIKTPGKDGKDGLVPLPSAQVKVVDGLDFPDAPSRESSYYRFVEQSVEDLDEMIEYDMDEEDYQWLSLINEDRKSQGLTSVPQEMFEILMDRLEKECCFESQTIGNGSEAAKNMYNIDENAVCCICNDGECHNTNAILFCDMCNLAVHQECYGVPYIPEGQWLCRRCLQSPSRGVDCVLCPTKGGGFKQTIDGKWAHVICAIWIPEVQFSNPVFLEPIDGIKEIPPARWKLTCYICRKKMGACIQCAKPNCYVAFHVTCAQQANLYMKLEPTKGGEVKKIAYCDAHTPPSVKRKLEKKAAEERARALAKANAEEAMEAMSEEVKEEGCEGGEEGSGEVCEAGDSGEGGEGKEPAPTKGKEESEGVKKARKLLGEKKPLSSQPVVNIPYVPQHRLDRIISRVNLHKKSQFIPKLVSYWKLKRQSRNGVPLLRRLQATNKGHRAATINLTEEEREVLAEQLTLWKNLRHDLERARLLIELVRKREKLKREQLRLLQSINGLQVKPLNTVMKRIVDRLKRKDPADIFAEPVSVDEVPDYLDVIKHPMDFSTMRKKIEENEYHTLDDFEKDFYLIWHNATIYNQKDTIYYRAAIRIKEAGHIIIQEAREHLDRAGVSSRTGLHDPEVDEPPPLTPTTIAQVVKQPMDLLEDHDDSDVEPSSSRARRRLSSTTSLSLDEQVEILQEKLEMVPSQYTGFSRKCREKMLKRELQALRRQQQKQLRKHSLLADSDDNLNLTSPPRRRERAPSIPRNAEELASHVIHGSLRLTPSRQQILSYSGIRLEERVSAMQQEQEEKQQRNNSGDSNLLQSQVAATSSRESLGGSSRSKSGGGTRENDVLEEEEEDRDEEMEEEKEEMEVDVTGGVKEKDDSTRGSRTDSAKVSLKIGRKRRHPPTGIKMSKSDSYVTKIRKKARKIRKGRSQRRKGMSEPNLIQRTSSRSSNRPQTRQRIMSSGTYTSTSEVENDHTSVNGVTHSRTGDESVFETGRTRRGISNSSSVYETPNEGYTSEEKRLKSPESDSSHRFNRDRSNSSRAAIPSASSTDDLTVVSVKRGGVRRRKGRKRKKSSSSDMGGIKKSRLASESSDGGATRGRTTINGLVNGDFEIKPMDLVWAKCRGYPSYPALVIDPDIPPDGLNVNGERIQAPSDEVLELRDKNSAATYLVRFFDGRRSWQWLPPDKIEPLGVDSEHDSYKITQSGSSKRSVKEAFQRAKHYQRRMVNRLKSLNASDADGDATDPNTNATDAENELNSDV